MAYYTGPNKTVKRLSKSSDSSGSSESSSSDQKLGSGITDLLTSPYLWLFIVVCVAIGLYLKYRN